MLKYIILLFIKIYQKYISILKPQTCRFYPTCSHYALECIEKFTLRYAFFLIVKRISKCHPFNKGGFDPVP